MCLDILAYIFIIIKYIALFNPHALLAQATNDTVKSPGSFSRNVPSFRIE